jgi:hypothetical protein
MYICYLRYPLPAMSLNENTCYSIQAPTLAALLPKLHLNRNIARSIVFGPIKYGGLAIKTLYSIQNIGQLTLFVGHSREKDKTSTLLNISISHMQLSVGTCTSVLQLPFSTYGAWLESYWLVSFWRFLQRASLSINLTPQWLPTHTQRGDIALIDHFVTQSYKAHQLIQLNRCRLYLQVITLTDIVSADGACNIPDIFIGLPLLDRRSTLKWPSQQLPSDKDWAVWSSGLKTLQPRNKLANPLGDWLVHSCRQHWFWFMDPILPHLYHYQAQSDNWKRSQGVSSTRRPTRSVPQLIFDTAQEVTVSSPTRALCPATVTTDRYTKLTTANRGPYFLAPPLSNNPTTWLSTPANHTYYSSVLGTQPGIIDQLRPLAAVMEESGISVVSRVLYEPPNLTCFPRLDGRSVV